MLEFIDAEFNKNFTRHCNLLFQLDAGRYAYAVYDPQFGKLHVLRMVDHNQGLHPDGLARLRVSLTSEDILQAPFNKVKICLVDTPFTLVPRVLFEEGREAAYLGLAATPSADDPVVSNNVGSMHLRNIFSLPHAEKALLLDIFSEPSWHHIGSALLETASRFREQFADQQILLDIKPGLMHVMYFEKKEFKFLNRFTYTDKDDFLYFVLLVAEQFEVDRESCDLMLSGDIVSDSLLYEALSNFFRHISFHPLNERIDLPEALRLQPLHVVHSLFSTDLCES